MPDKFSSPPFPPGPQGRWPLGNLADFGRDPLGFLTHCARRYGDIVGLRFGRWPVYLLNHPDFIELVLVSHARNFRKSTLFHRHMTALFGRGLLTSEGEFWRRQRRLSAPAFHSERIARYGEIMVRYTERMLSGWRAGERRDIHQDMMGLTMRIVAKALFDTELDREVAEISRTFSAVVQEISARFTRPFAIPDSFPTPGNLRYRRGCRQVDQLVRRLIRRRRESAEDRGDLLSLLLGARDEDGRGMSERQVRDEVITQFLGGHETTAIALSWTWYLLARHPAVESRLIDELAAVLGGRLPTMADYNRLPYTEAVIKEALRLFPPAWAIVREALDDCEIGGYPVAAGVTLALSPWVLHRDARYFDQPEAFRPERWLDGETVKPPRHVYLPFGGGPRNCIGQRFAMLEAVLVVATVAQRFQLIWQPRYPLQPFPSITLRPGGGVWVVLSARQGNKTRAQAGDPVP